MKTMTLDEFLAEYSSPDVIVARAARDRARRIFVAARIASFKFKLFDCACETSKSGFSRQKALILHMIL